MDLQLTGKRAFVSGSTAGIGFAIAAALAREGAQVVVNGRTEQRVRQALDKLKGSGLQADGIAADLGTAAGAAEVIRRFPEIDILVNNVGIFDPKPFEAIPDSDWLRFFEVNVMSGVRLSRAYLPRMKERNWGRIVFISSESALQIPAETNRFSSELGRTVWKNSFSTSARPLFPCAAMPATNSSTPSDAVGPGSSAFTVTPVPPWFPPTHAKRQVGPEEVAAWSGRSFNKSSLAFTRRSPNNKRNCPFRTRHFPTATCRLLALPCYLELKDSTMQPTTSLDSPAPREVPSRATINRENSQHSTGPRTQDGKQRSSENSLKHGLTSRTPVLRSEDPAAFERHCRAFHEEYQPQTPTELQLVGELADTAWRLNRIPALEAQLLDIAERDLRWNGRIPSSVAQATRSLATLGLHAQRLSRQFNKTLTTLRQIQAERRVLAHQAASHPQLPNRAPTRPQLPNQAHTRPQLPNQAPARPQLPNDEIDPNHSGFVFSNPQFEPGDLRPTPTRANAASTAAEFACSGYTKS